MVHRWVLSPEILEQKELIWLLVRNQTEPDRSANEMDLRNIQGRGMIIRTN